MRTISLGYWLRRRRELAEPEHVEQATAWENVVALVDPGHDARMVVTFDRRTQGHPWRIDVDVFGTTLRGVGQSLEGAAEAWMDTYLWYTGLGRV